MTVTARKLLLLPLVLVALWTSATLPSTAALAHVSNTAAAAAAAQLQRTQQQQQQRSSPPPICPKISPVTGLENRFYTWKHGQQIRYQRTTTITATNTDGKQGQNGSSSKVTNRSEPVLLVHGLFVNADHWRKTLLALQDAGYSNAYALDLFGCGYSDKPPAASDIAQACNGENGRFENGILQQTGVCESGSVLRNVELGTANGQAKRIVDVDLRHPLGSPYNFYTWADLISDFCRDVILQPDESDPNRSNNDRSSSSSSSTVSLVANSIGTISALQAVIDQPELFKGVFVVAPNFRELHSAEVPFPAFTMPILRTNQRLLRERGQPVFDLLAKPSIVKDILLVPYAVKSAVDDALVQVLLDPLLTPGASQVVFDLLSYSAGPLPEQQLQRFPFNKPVWVCYGDKDPWTPGPRVEALTTIISSGGGSAAGGNAGGGRCVVERVVKIEGAGHCPHDEAPELVNPLLFEFLKRVEQNDE